MTRLSAAAVARLLTELGQRTLLAGGNPYRARAFMGAAETLAGLAAPLDAVIAGGGLRALPGIGETIAAMIETMARTGTDPALEALRSEIPDGVLGMLAVPGLRVDRVRKLHTELGISSVEALEEAAREGRLAATKGFGPALERRVLEGIELSRGNPGARHLHRASELLDSAAAQLRAADPTLTRITPAGDFRRGGELVTDLAVVVEAPAASGAPAVRRSGDLAITFTDAEHHGAALLAATGSAAHLDQLRAIARERGLELTAEGLFRDGRNIASRREDDIYAALGLPLIPPELREGGNEIERARAGKFERLVSDGDLRGILHAHTTASDGVASLAEMAEATKERGYGYLGVSDHSRTAGYAGGLTIGQVEAQLSEIEQLNAGYAGSFRVFKGIESDILPDGALDYPEEILAGFDFVIASIHRQFRLNREEQTGRLLKAVANRHTTILGHMTGRQLLRRRGYDVDVERVLAACADHGVAVEINANPWRLDLDWRWHETAIELGCRFAINPDAHSTSEIDLVHWGVLLARKGGVSRDQVINCRDREGFADYLAGRR